MNRLLLLLLVSISIEAFGATYYIDYDSGADTNNGTTKGTAWKRAPGMIGCSNTCSSTTPQAGDNFIFKGGVTWPNAVLGWQWSWSGNATTASPGCSGSGCIYVGVDQTWYTGASWTRPKIDAQGSVVATNAVANTLLRIYANYLIVDNLEFKGLYWTGVPAYGTGVNIQIAGGTPGVGTNVELKNLYIHGWSHNTAASGTTENPCGVAGDTGLPNNNVNSIIHDSIIDGSDTAKDSCTAIFGSPPYVVNNYINDVTSGLITNGTVLVDGNTITNIHPSFETTAHTNGIEINLNEDIIISNNLIAHLGTGTLGIWCAPIVGKTCYIFNNVMFDTDTGNVLDLAAPLINNGCANNGTYCNSGGAALVYNNTVECGPDSNPNAVCTAGISSAISAVTLQNNHWITNATTPNGGMWSTNGVTPTVTTNVLQSKSTASGQGMTASQTPPFYPTAGSSVLSAGTNMTASCTGSLATLCATRAAGVTLDSGTYTVTATSSNTRTTSGSWDVGAYKYVASGSSPTRGVCSAEIGKLLCQ